ncbi:MAG: hypothetical protein M3332_10755 [Actinomycetota bacterium]|nr:hypothetical protein [Actinomycetota bacterium]
MGGLHGQVKTQFASLLEVEHHGVAQPGADRAAQAPEQDLDRIGTGQRGRREGTLVAGSEDLVAGHPGVSDDDAEAGDGTRDADSRSGRSPSLTMVSCSAASSPGWYTVSPATGRSNLNAASRTTISRLNDRGRMRW